MPAPASAGIARGADAARADDRDAGRLKSVLPDPADLGQDDVARVAVEFVVGQRHGLTPVEPKPPAPRAVSHSSSTSSNAARRHRGGDELGDALAAADREGLAAVVDQEDLQLAAIVAVDRAGGVGDADAMLEGEARARADLDFIASGDGDAEAGGDGVALAGARSRSSAATTSIPAAPGLA